MIALASKTKKRSHTLRNSHYIPAANRKSQVDLAYNTMTSDQQMNSSINQEKRNTMLPSLRQTVTLHEKPVKTDRAYQIAVNKLNDLGT